MKITKDMQELINYIVEHESEDYFLWCKENDFEIDDPKAMSKHVFGAACRVLGRLPSYYVG